MPGQKSPCGKSVIEPHFRDTAYLLKVEIRMEILFNFQGKYF